ncbi:hypothetical protein DFH27DRAFT_631501 [Peziza echinospora]|nr:hypothetical protein DFH27DRAFT_631501 [Peziza echinospora]
MTTRSAAAKRVASEEPSPSPPEKKAAHGKVGKAIKVGGKAPMGVGGKTPNKGKEVAIKIEPGLEEEQRVKAKGVRGTKTAVRVKPGPSDTLVDLEETISTGHGTTRTGLELNTQIVELMKGSQDSADWKGRINVFFAQLFMRKRGLPADEREVIFNQLVPARLQAYEADLIAHYETTYSAFVETLRRKVEMYGKQFLESDAGKAWMSRAHECKIKHHPNPVKPDKEGESITWGGSEGLRFGRLENIDFWGRLLFYLETEDLPYNICETRLGWLRYDAGDAIMELTRESAMELILLYIHSEGARKGSYNTRAMVKDLAGSKTLCKEWVAFREVPDYRLYYEKGYRGLVAYNTQGQKAEKMEEESDDESEDGSHATNNEPASRSESPQAAEAQSNGETSDYDVPDVDEEKWMKLANEYAEKAQAEYERDYQAKLEKQLRMEIEAESFTDTILRGRKATPNEYANRLSNEYAKSTIWGKISLTRQEVMYYKMMQESRVYAINLEIERCNAELAGIDQMEQALKYRKEKISQLLGEEKRVSGTVHKKKEELMQGGAGTNGVSVGNMGQNAGTRPGTMAGTMQQYSPMHMFMPGYGGMGGMMPMMGQPMQQIGQPGGLTPQMQQMMMQQQMMQQQQMLQQQMMNSFMPIPEMVNAIPHQGPTSRASSTGRSATLREQTPTQSSAQIQHQLADYDNKPSASVENATTAAGAGTQSRANLSGIERKADPKEAKELGGDQNDGVVKEEVPRNSGWKPV